VEQDRLFNAVGSSITLRDPERLGSGKPRRRSPAALLSHLLLGIEALMLRTIIDAYPEDVVLPMHDGWVSRRKLDVVELERLIFDKTGFAMSIDEEQIELPEELRFGGELRKVISLQASDSTQESGNRCTLVGA
jgi:hypothetical protein